MAIAAGGIENAERGGLGHENLFSGLKSKGAGDEGIIGNGQRLRGPFRMTRLV
jgi:hypothetical protein